MPVESDITCFHSAMMTATGCHGKIRVRVEFWSYAKTPSVPSGQLPQKMGKRLRPKGYHLPLPRSRSIGVYADAGEGSEGVLQQAQIKTYPPPMKPPIS